MKIKSNNKISVVLLSIFFLNYFFNFTFSAPHISGKYIKGQPKDKVKVLPDVSHLRKKGAPALEIAKYIGSIGTKKIAVIIVDFPDKQFSSGWATQANQTFTQIKNYYNEVSYNKLQLDITFVYNGGITKVLTGNELPYRMPRNMSYYGKDTNDSLAQLVKDAIIATGGIVYKIYYDYVMVLHAGYGNESTNNPDDIWSVYIDWDGAVNGFTDGTIVPEKELGASPVGVTCHEFGHQLGLPDLYYDQESIVGSWCLMDYGVWLGSPQGSQPAHLSAWCKQFLGWVDTKIISSTAKSNALHYIETVSTAVIKIPIITATKPDREYFLLEYRRKVGFDADLPGAGLLIWKIDDDIASSPERIKNNNINSGTPHYGVDLIEADRSSAGKTLGDSGDPFPGSNNITTFFPQEYNVTAYNGHPINIMLSNIATDVNYAYFDIISFSGLYAVVTRLNGFPLSDVKIELTKNNINISTFSYTSVNGVA
ncbi:MAG: M6 family metalloprotease domain-containing protein, partial [Endomicrobia bacterium]|nr:M6 family metalloprotease domain-containing protein [Endomicrobiia bacterium]